MLFHFLVPDGSEWSGSLSSHYPLSVLLDNSLGVAQSLTGLVPSGNLTHSSQPKEDTNETWKIRKQVKNRSEQRMTLIRSHCSESATPF
jgi:hypothetical protein